MVKQLRSNRNLIINILIAVFILSSIGCFNIDGQRDVTEHEIIEVEEFIKSFYCFLSNYIGTKINVADINKWYLNGNTNVQISGSNPNFESIGILNTHADLKFYEFVRSFYRDYGKVEDIELLNISFYEHRYDSPPELFKVRYHVIYENGDTYESFSLKKDGDEYKIWLYFVDIE